MLIEFKVSNYRSIGDEQILSLVPAPQLDDFPENILEQGKFKALNVLALYGANASGKSNILRAIETLRWLLYNSQKASSTAKLPYSPFLLKQGYDEKPTCFELIFATNDTRYRFGLSYNQDQVLTEFLYRKKNGSREIPLFLREKDVIEVYPSLARGSQKLIDAAIEATRDNALFLSFCDMFNIQEAKHIFESLARLVYVDGLNTQGEGFTTVQLLTEKAYQDKIKTYLGLLGLGFVDLEVQAKELDLGQLASTLSEEHKSRLSEILKPSKRLVPRTVHQIYNADNEKSGLTRVWDLEDYESKGTEKAFHLSGPILKILAEGGLLVIDEMEAKMHPIMTLSTVNLFLNRSTNPQQAQLIFATHDTNLLSYAHLRRDQINFVEKNSWESTELYALSDFKYMTKPNHSTELGVLDADKEKRYLEGRYGAIPMLGDFLTKISQKYGQKG